MGLEAPSALVLSPEIIKPPAQPLNRPGDVTDIVAGDCCLTIGGQAGLLSCIWAVGQPVPLKAKAQGVPKPEVCASAFGIPPDGWSVLGEDRSGAEKAGHKDEGSHCPSMTQGLRSAQRSDG